MKVSVNILKQLGNIEQASTDIIKAIKEHLGEVESVQDLSSAYENIIVAEIAEKAEHPNAEKLGVYQLNIGPEDKIQVLAGDKTLEVGDKVAYLKPGAKVPYTIYSEEEPMIIEPRKMRDIMSNGMMGSEKELNLGPDHSVVMRLTKDAIPGQPFAQYYQLDDYIIDIENKALTNRGDLFGLLGLAREITVIFGNSFKTPAWYLDQSRDLIPETSCLSLEITNDAEVLCPRYTAVAMDNIAMQESPLWLKSTLIKLGYKPINNVVDITNYISHLAGQPLHAFDYDKVVTKDPNSNGIAHINIRMAKEGESILGLDGKVHNLNDRVMIIADNTNPIAIAGIMGGAETEVDQNTKRIIIECANFDKTSIRKTSMMLGLSTEAATKFKHALSTEQCIPVLKETVREIQELANGKVASDIVDIYPAPAIQKEIVFSLENLKTLTGLDLDNETVLQILTNLEYEILNNKDDNITVKAPHWRQDISIKEDIFEDVARVYGYNNIEPVLPTKTLTPTRDNGIYALKKNVRQLLSDNGCNETDTYSFTDANTIKKAGLDPEKAYSLKNPLSPELSLMRTSVLPTLLSKAQYNIQEGIEKMGLFEMNLAHQKGYVEKDGLPVENWHLDMILTSTEKREDSAYYLAKTYTEKIFNMAGINPNYKIVADMSEKDIPENIKYLMYMFDANSSALIVYHGEIIGLLGEVDNKVKASFKLPKFTAGIDINLEKLVNIDSTSKTSHKISKFPESRVDLCFEVGNNVLYSDLYEIINKEINDEELIGTATCLDVYQDNKEKTKKRITFRVSIRNIEKTLTEKDIKTLTDVIIKKIEKATKGILI